MLFSLLTLTLGKNYYIITPPQGSIISHVVCLVWVPFSKLFISIQLRQHETANWPDYEVN